MSIADKLGMDSSNEASQTPPEDLMEMEVSVRYHPTGRWNVVSMNRHELQTLLNIPTPFVDGIQVRELRLVTFEGEDCNLEVTLFWDVDGRKYWRVL